jgi:predicted DNA-binding transcriptional regulator YafY
MAVTRNAWLRYKVLDRCLGNSGRKYTFNDLKDEIDAALIEIDPIYEGLSVRQLRKDIQFLQSDAGYNAPIEIIIEGRQRYYRYSERFSIHQNPLNETEYRQLQQAISTLRNFEGRQEFEWLNELGPQLDDKLGAKSHKPIIGYETNIDYSGSIHIPELFNAILNKRVLSLVYKPFKGEPILVTCHPYYLKQYNGRWFLFGRHEELENDQWNFPLDRIESITETNLTYLNDKTDWEDYFYDIVGVTKPNRPEEEIKLRISANRLPYIRTKPLHPSQKIKTDESGNTLVYLRVIPNLELRSLILSFGSDIQVYEPHWLRRELINIIEKMCSKYN